MIFQLIIEINTKSLINLTIGYFEQYNITIRWINLNKLTIFNSNLDNLNK